MPKPLSVTSNRVVSMGFQIRQVIWTDGQRKEGPIIEETEEGQPEIFLYKGANETILKAWQDAMYGMRAGDCKAFDLRPEEAHGYPEEANIREVPLDCVPEDARKAGATFNATDDEGDISLIKVKEVRKDTAILDCNHPLAGCYLRISVAVLCVRDATREEISQGKADPCDDDFSDDQGDDDDSGEDDDYEP